MSSTVCKREKVTRLSDLDEDLTGLLVKSTRARFILLPHVKYLQEEKSSVQVTTIQINVEKLLT